MTFPTRLRSGRAAALVALLLLPVLDVPLASPQVRAQSLEALLVQRRLELTRAREEYEAAVAARNVMEGQWRAALEQASAARRSGDDEALEHAWAAAQERAGPFSAQEQRAAMAQDSVVAARRALVEVIQARLEQLLDALDAARSARERAELDILFTDLRNELQALDAEEEDGLSLRPVVLPDVQFDPRDGPEDYEVKAQLLERQAALVQSLAVDVTDRMRTLENRLRIQRQSGDLLANVDRFDDTRVPVVAGPPRGGVAADSTTAGGRPLTLEERIQELETYRAWLDDYHARLLQRAETFRRRIGRITW